MARLTAEELAELIPTSPEEVARLTELGILVADEDATHAPADVHVVRLMGAFEGAGIALEDVARGVADGQLSFPLGLLLPEPAAMTRCSASSSRASTSPRRRAFRARCGSAGLLQDPGLRADYRLRPAPATAL